MNDEHQKIVRTPSQITYDYATIRITQSRVNKGLLALPRTIADWFPKSNENIEVYLNDSPTSETKRYSSYTSSTRECRIGGLRDWFGENNVINSGEIVVQLIDKEKYIYRLIPEKNFVTYTNNLQQSLDKVDSEEKARQKISSLSIWTNTSQDNVAINEFIRLIYTGEVKKRQEVKKNTQGAMEGVPANIRVLLRKIYNGHCQICDFWFLKKNNEPYFEIHHVDRMKGHHPKNLVVVCGNCHNQFTHARLKQEFNNRAWLINVQFNEKIYSVKQIVSQKEPKGFFKNLFL